MPTGARRIAAILIVCTCALAASATSRFAHVRPNATAPPQPAPLPIGTPFDELLSRATAHPISVIVGLTLEREWVPEGLLSADAAKEQRAAIDDAIAHFGSRYADKKNAQLRSLAPIPYVIVLADIDFLQRMHFDSAITSMEWSGTGSGGLQQSVPQVAAPAAWSANFTGDGQTIVIIDSGVDKDHAFLQGKVIAEACFSFPDPAWPTSSSLCPPDLLHYYDPGAGVNCPTTITGCSHGTHVAGIAAGSLSTSAIWGVARGATIFSIQVDHKNPEVSACYPDPAPCARFNFDDLYIALTYVDAWAAEHPDVHIAAINLSLKSTFLYPDRDTCTASRPGLFTAVRDLSSHGIPVVGITGNDGNKGRLSLPGCIRGIIDVGAVTKDDFVASFSNSTSEFDLLAPGTGNAAHPNITSSVPGAGSPYAGMSGTSMAAPHVAGALAILRQKSPKASVDTLLQDLVTAGVPRTDSNGFTKPRINVWGALNADHTPPTPPTGLTASATSGTTILLTWNAASDEHGVAGYSIQRRSSTSAVFAQVNTAVGLSYTDNTSTDATYQYQVVALDTSGNTSAASNRDLATTVIFSGDPLLAQTKIRDVHLTELRQATNSIRAFASLAPATWTDASLVNMPVRAVHVQEVRDRLNEALTAIGITPPTYTDPTLIGGTTMIKTSHITEVRTAAK